MDAIVIGDGPGGLAAALLLAKNGLAVVVYGENKTALHYAWLKNYLGLPEMHGSEFQKIACEQVQAFGAKLVHARVESVAAVADGYEATLSDGTAVSAPFMILSEGKSPRLAQQLGLTFDPVRGLAVDINGQTRLPGVYAVGRLARPQRSQVMISAGDGAAAAIDILSTRKGAPVQDWDEPPAAA
jgi:thioredoxin reductase